MGLAFYLACVAFPFVAALQRYAVAYGYEGVTEEEAKHSATGVLMIASIISIVVLVVRS